MSPRTPHDLQDTAPTSADEAAEQDLSAPPARRLRARSLLVPSIIWAALTVAFVALLRDTSAPTIVAAALISAITVAGYHLFRFLATHLGRLTAAAALSVIGATVLGGWAAIAPNCPDGPGVDRCSLAEVGTWAFAGVLLPAGYLVTLGVPLVIAGFAWRGIKAGARAARATATKPHEQP